MNKSYLSHIDAKIRKPIYINILYIILFTCGALACAYYWPEKWYFWVPTVAATGSLLTILFLLAIPLFVSMNPELRKFKREMEQYRSNLKSNLSETVEKIETEVEEEYIATLYDRYDEQIENAKERFSKRPSKEDLEDLLKLCNQWLETAASSEDRSIQREKTIWGWSAFGQAFTLKTAILNKLNRKDEAYKSILHAMDAVGYCEDDDFEEYVNSKDFKRWLHDSGQVIKAASLTPIQQQQQKDFFEKFRQKLQLNAIKRAEQASAEQLVEWVHEDALKAYLTGENYRGQPDGPILYIQGDVFIDADLTLSKAENSLLKAVFGDSIPDGLCYSEVIIEGNLVVTGSFCDAEPIYFYCTGDVVVDNLLHQDAIYQILGDVHANQLIHGEYNDGSLEILGKAHAPMVFSNDHDMTAGDYALFSQPLQGARFAAVPHTEILNGIPGYRFNLEWVLEQLEKNLPIIKPQYHLAQGAILKEVK